MNGRIEMNDRNLVKNIANEDFNHIIESQIRPANYLLPIKSGKTKRDRTFHDNERVWQAILEERLRANMTLTLENFLILEWFPRSPGLFFTQEGRQSRERAQLFVESIEKKGSEDRYALASSGDSVTVYNPHGKVAMLRGGLGAIRLRPRPIGSSEHWFMCASSNGIAHEGLPLALRQEIYDECIDEIVEHGASRHTIVGKLQFVSENLVSLYGYPGVPQLYLQVEELRPASGDTRDHKNDLAVTVGVSFKSNYEGGPGVYASYVYFDPARPESFQRNVGWMEETYIQGKYQGKIITDFDELMPRFADAPFSLSKVMDYKLNRTEVNQVLGEGAADRLFNGLKAAEIRMEVHVGDRYEIKGQAAVVGRGAQAHDINFNQVWNEKSSDLDLVALSTELEQLRSALRRESETAEQDGAIGEIAAAEVAARNGDGPTALERLARAGSWALGVAEKVGTTVAAAAIKSALGL